MSLFICLIPTCLLQPLDVLTMSREGKEWGIREEQIDDSHLKRDETCSECNGARMSGSPGAGCHGLRAHLAVGGFTSRHWCETEGSQADQHSCYLLDGDWPAHYPECCEGICREGFKPLIYTHLRWTSADVVKFWCQQGKAWGRESFVLLQKVPLAENKLLCRKVRFPHFWEEISQIHHFAFITSSQ